MIVTGSEKETATVSANEVGAVVDAAPKAVKPDGTFEEGKDGSVFLWYAGERFEMSLPGEDDYAAARDRLKSVKRDPLDALVESLEALDKRHGERTPSVVEDIKKRFTERAYAELNTPPEHRVTSREELAEWLNQAEAGKRFLFYRLLLRRAPSLTEATASRIYDAASQAGYAEAMEKVRALTKERVAAAGAQK